MKGAMKGIARATVAPMAIALSLAWTSALCSCKGKGSWRVGVAPDAAADAQADGAPAEAGPKQGGATTAAATVEAGPPDDVMPPPTSDELTTRARHLLEALAQDDATLADDILFPRDGWIATRDAEDAGKDWEKKIHAPFRKTIHRLSRKEKGLDQAQSVAIEPGAALTQVTPKRHGWKKPLWVLTGARVSFVVDGRTRTLSIREMTAWRGAWYVTRLK
jgi:hypothetical protein